MFTTYNNVVANIVNDKNVYVSFSFSISGKIDRFGSWLLGQKTVKIHLKDLSDPQLSIIYLPWMYFLLLWQILHGHRSRKYFRSMNSTKAVRQSCIIECFQQSSKLVEDDKMEQNTIVMLKWDDKCFFERKHSFDKTLDVVLKLNSPLALVQYHSQMSKYHSEMSKWNSLEQIFCPD